MYVIHKEPLQYMYYPRHAHAWHIGDLATTLSNTTTRLWCVATGVYTCQSQTAFTPYPRPALAISSHISVASHKVSRLQGHATLPSTNFPIRLISLGPQPHLEEKHTIHTQPSYQPAQRSHAGYDTGYSHTASTPVTGATMLFNLSPSP
jgi:hypothetical protein